MKIEIEISIYEEKGGLSSKELKLTSHWNRDNLVVLEFDGRKITVCGSQLEKAIRRVTNWRW